MGGRSQTAAGAVCSLSSFSRFGVRFDFKIVDPGSARSSFGGANVHRTFAITHLTRGLVLGGADARWSVSAKSPPLASPGYRRGARRLYPTCWNVHSRRG